MGMPFVGYFFPPHPLLLFIAMTFVSFHIATRLGKRRAKQKPRAQKIAPEIRRLESFGKPCISQDECTLFSAIPAEIRYLIYEYVFADFEDMSQPFDLDTVYRRPEYFGPRRSHIALLQTCQTIYEETWYMPWTNAQQTMFLTQVARRPPKTTSRQKMQDTLNMLESLHPDIPRKRKEFSDFQVFAQLFALERGYELQELLDMNYFFPRCVTITVRHADCWDWEIDAILHINYPWVRECRFPESVTKLRIQMETLERKKLQLDHIMNKMKENWYFQRKDGTLLLPDPNFTTLNWTGSSTWHNARWVRDEVDSAPGVLQFYMATLSFRPPSSDRKVKISKLDLPQLLIAEGLARPLITRYAALNQYDMDKIGIDKNTPASEAIIRMARHHGLPISNFTNIVGESGSESESNDGDENSLAAHIETGLEVEDDQQVDENANGMEIDPQ